MKFKLEIDSEDAHATDQPLDCIARAFLIVSNRMDGEDGKAAFSGTLRDINGNRMGTYRFVPSEDDEEDEE